MICIYVGFNVVLHAYEINVAQYKYMQLLACDFDVFHLHPITDLS